MAKDLKPFNDTCPLTQRPVEVAQCEKCPQCKAIVESKITCVIEGKVISEVKVDKVIITDNGVSIIGEIKESKQ